LSYIPVFTVLTITKASFITRCIENSPFRPLASTRIAKAAVSVKQRCTQTVSSGGHLHAPMGALSADLKGCGVIAPEANLAWVFLSLPVVFNRP